MWFLWLLGGFLVGAGVGFIVAAWMAVESDKYAVACGVIKLCGKLFALKEIDV